MIIGRRLAVAVVVVLALTGCGSASPPSPPAGVDGLVIPTPSPDPDDFVNEATNPWLPLTEGASWRLESADGSVVTMATTEGPVIGGIATTTLRTTVDDGQTSSDHLAQDRAGNVWWLGRDDEPFPEPGLAMPAKPRVGDGFRMAAAPGVDVRARVDSVDEDAEVPLGEYAPVVVLEITENDRTRRESYARGVGLVRRTASDTELGLVAHAESQ